MFHSSKFVYVFQYNNEQNCFHNFLDMKSNKIKNVFNKLIEKYKKTFLQFYLLDLLV